MIRCCPALAGILVCLFLLLGNGPARAVEDARSEPVESSQQISSGSADEEVLGGYPVEGRVSGGPTDVDTDLATSFPSSGSVLPWKPPDEFFDWKKDLYEKAGVKLSFSYQMLFQWASETRGDADTAWGGWMLLEGKWDAICRGKNFQGSLVVDLDWRHTIGGNANPALFGAFEVGSIWFTDIAFFEWDPSVALLYWEQWFKKDVFMLRVGKQLAANTYDFFRFQDPRTSFTATPFTLHNSIPAPAFGQAVSFKWWPVKDSTLYIHGTLNDMNGDPERLGLDTFFEKGQFFYGLEIGYFWKREFPKDFDHVHLDLFYADERDDQPPFLPNEAGGGFKLLGSKQWGRWVSFGSYTFNTAQAGGQAASYGRHTLTGGLAYLKPLGIRGEAALGIAWMDPIEDGLRNQTGGEAYWKLLLLPDLWITPGLQFIWNPTVNPDTDFVAIPQIKFRLFF